MKNTVKFIAAFVLSMFLLVPASAATTVLNGDEISVVQAPEKDKKAKKESKEAKKECKKECCDKKESCDKKKEESKEEKKAE